MQRKKILHQLHLFSLPSLLYTTINFNFQKHLKTPFHQYYLNWNPKTSIIWPNLIQL